MAPMVSSEHGFDPSCGDFGVKFQLTESYYSNRASLEVEYDQLVDTDHVLHHAVIPWEGGEISVEEVEELLNSANVPVCIQYVSAIDMFLRCVDEIVKDGRGLLVSVLLKIVSDQETVDYDEYLNE